MEIVRSEDEFIKEKGLIDNNPTRQLVRQFLRLRINGHNVKLREQSSAALVSLQEKNKIYLQAVLNMQ